MKEYIEKETNFCNSSRRNTYYIINDKNHGFYFSISYNNNILVFKGYYNMDMEYSHWLQFKENFIYFL